MLDRFVVSAWANRGLLKPIDEYLRNSKITRSQFVESAFDEMTYKKKVWGLPFTMGTYGLMWNKARFKEVGLDPDNPPEKLEELDLAATKLTTMGSTNTIQYLGLVPWSCQGYLYSWGWAFGGSFYDDENDKITANDPKIVKALAWYQDYARRYTLSSINKFFASSGDYFRAFSKGKLAMLPVASDWPAELYMSEKNIGVTYFPYPSYGAKTTWQAGFGFCIPKSVNVTPEVWDFFKYLTGPEATKEFAMKANSNFPSYKSAVFAQDFKANARQAAFISLLKTAKVYSRPVMPAGDIYWDKLDQAVQSVINGKKEPKAALDSVTKEVQAELDKHLKRSRMR